MPLTNGMMKSYLEIGDIIANSNNTDSGEIDVHDIVIRILCNELIHKVDDALFLLDNGRTYSIDTIMKTCLELSVILKYILMKGKKDKKSVWQRARACFYWHKVTNADKAKDMLAFSNDEEREILEQEISKIMKQISAEIETVDQYKEHYVEKRDNCFPVKLSKNMRKNWYNHDGSIGGIRDLFKYVGMEEQYAVFYRPLSDATHGVDALTHLVVDKYSFGTTEHLDRATVESMLNSYLFLLQI